MSVYRFGVRFELDPQPGVSTDPREFETALHRTARAPEEAAWPLFESWLWHGELTDESHFREEATAWLDVPVVAAWFSEYRTTPAELESLRDAVAADLDRFGGESVRDVLHRHFGSSIRVVEEEDT